MKDFIAAAPVTKKSVQNAIGHIRRFESDDGYESAFIFGSVARDDATEQSDLDVQVIVTEENPTIAILHPVLDGVKLDLSFLSFGQLVKRTNKENGNIPQRIPMIAESIILFDKVGRLTELKNTSLEKMPPKFESKDHDQQRFLLFHANDKVERNVDLSPETALLAMHIGINDVLKIHYGLAGRWWLSNKRLLRDMNEWDAALARMLSDFLCVNDAMTKFGFWSKILDHVSRPLGGYKNISTHSSLSEISQKGLQRLTEASTVRAA